MGIAVRVWQRPPELPVVAEAFRRLVAVGVRRPLDGMGRARARCDGARWSGRGRPVAGRAGTPPVGSSGGSCGSVYRGPGREERGGPVDERRLGVPLIVLGG